MVVRGHICDDRFLVWLIHIHIYTHTKTLLQKSYRTHRMEQSEFVRTSVRLCTLRIQQFGEPHLFLCDVEGVLQVVVSVGALQLVKLD